MQSQNTANLSQTHQITGESINVGAMNQGSGSQIEMNGIDASNSGMNNYI